MPLFINHRINTIKQLAEVPSDNGVEVDVREYKSKIILSHDPFCNGETLNKFLKKIGNRMTILNIKSFGLLKFILKKIKNKNNFFFLDLSFSEIHELIDKGFANKIILRFSKYEKFDLNSKHFNNIKWIWYDYFDKELLKKKDYKLIKKNNKNICIVSPELVGGNKKDIKNFINYLNKNKFKINAICTKNKFIKYWKANYKYD